LEFVKVIAGGAVGLTCGYLLLCWISPGKDFLNLFGRPVTVIEQPSPAVVQPVQAVPMGNQTDSPPLATVAEPIAPEAKPAIDPPRLQASETSLEKPERLEALRDSAASRGELVAALKAVDELARLRGDNSLEAKLLFVSTREEESGTSRQAIATQMANLLDQAIAEKRLDLAAQHVDQLLLLARNLDDPELERRATLIALGRPSRQSVEPRPADPAPKK
jgi:hypothetical protein